MRFNFSY